jgi:hypothetical protein
MVPRYYWAVVEQNACGKPVNSALYGSSDELVLLCVIMSRPMLRNEIIGMVVFNAVILLVFRRYQ